MAPGAKVAGVRIIDAEGRWVEWLLPVVHVVANHCRDLCSRVARTNVLTVAAATSCASDER